MVTKSDLTNVPAAVCHIVFPTDITYMLKHFPILSLFSRLFDINSFEVQRCIMVNTISNRILDSQYDIKEFCWTASCMFVTTLAAHFLTG